MTGFTVVLVVGGKEVMVEITVENNELSVNVGNSEIIFNPLTNSTTVNQTIDVVGPGERVKDVRLNFPM